MSTPWLDPDVWTVCCLGIGGPLLGLLGLLKPPSSARTCCRTLPLALGILVACGCGLAAWLEQPPGIWLPPLAWFLIAWWRQRGQPSSARS